MAEKRYRNIGTSPVNVKGERQMPGKEFVADLGDEREKFLVGIGALEVLPSYRTITPRTVKASLDVAKGEDS